MDIAWAFNHLGLDAPTTDLRAIKSAYARRLKAARPEADVNRFQNLVAAYEQAMAWARGNAVDSSGPPRLVLPVNDEPPPAETDSSGPPRLVLPVNDEPPPAETVPIDLQPVSPTQIEGAGKSQEAKGPLSHDQIDELSNRILERSMWPGLADDFLEQQEELVDLRIRAGVGDRIANNLDHSRQLPALGDLLLLSAFFDWEPGWHDTPASRVLLRAQARQRLLDESAQRSPMARLLLTDFNWTDYLFMPTMVIRLGVVRLDRLQVESGGQAELILPPRTLAIWRQLAMGGTFVAARLKLHALRAIVLAALLAQLNLATQFLLEAPLLPWWTIPVFGALLFCNSLGLHALTRWSTRRRRARRS